jgi:hypothetical protein
MSQIRIWCGKPSAPRARQKCLRQPGALDQPALVDRSTDERGKKRVRLERPRLELGVELHPDEPGMIFIFDHLGQ